jgi:hypothetical protein
MPEPAKLRAPCNEDDQRTTKFVTNDASGAFDFNSAVNENSLKRQHFSTYGARANSVARSVLIREIPSTALHVR